MSICLWLFTVFYSVVRAEASDVSLMRIDGVKQSMQEYIGQGNWVIANIWSPSCSFCVQELPKIAAFHAKHRDEGIIVLGITVDYPSFQYGNIDDIKQFLRTYPLNYPIFLADLELASAVIGNRLIGIPLTVIYHPDGRVLGRWAGDIHVKEIEEFMKSYSDYTDDWISGS